MPDLARPWVLFLLIPLAYLAWRWFRASPEVLLQSLPEEWGRGGRNPGGPSLSRYLRILALAFLVLALAGPRNSKPEEEPPGQGVAVMLALDLSGSMETPDLEGRTRLEVALEEMERFVRARPGDLMGLVTFGEEALTRVPPTTRHGHLLRTLEALEVDRDEGGTALGAGLGLAVQRISGQVAPSRVVILVTDGRHNTGAMGPGAVARAAAGLEVRIHTLGVGRGRGEDPLDETLLRQVAGATGGEYARTLDPRGFRRVMDALDALETGRLPGKAHLVRRPLHLPFLALGILFLLLEGILWSRPGGRIS